MPVGSEKLQFQTIYLFNNNYEKYIVLLAGKTFWANWKNLFSCLFTQPQYKVVKEEIFTAVLQKHELEPAHVRKTVKNLYKFTF